jgi:signal transduction histidine kinase
VNHGNFKDFFIGEGAVMSRAEFKRLMLTTYLAIICIFVSVIYLVIDTINGVFYSLPAYAVLFFVPIAGLMLIRKKRYKIAKVMMMIAANLVVFWAAITDPFETGVFLLFIPAGVGSFAILGIAESKTGISLSFLTALLFVSAYFADLQLPGIEAPSATYVKISFFFNYIISLVISVLIVYFLMNLNKLSEDDLIQKENFANLKNIELQKVNEELDRFVYSVSHDLRSPLSSILGLINIARLTDDKNELNDILKMIEGRVQVQDHFIREIIDYSRNARTETVREKVLLRSLVDEVFFSLQFNKFADKIDFRNSIHENLSISSDRIRLTVILSNLIGNAIKYHDFTKEHPFIEVSMDAQTETIFVQDNGTGMKPEHQEKIFNMFYRGSDRSGGSGLGLFITREAVHKLGGSIKVSSVYGEGSIFTVHLPFGDS